MPSRLRTSRGPFVVEFLDGLAGSGNTTLPDIRNCRPPERHRRGCLGHPHAVTHMSSVTAMP